MKRASKLSALDMLDKNIEKKSELKEKELELKRMELEMMKIEMDREYEERKKQEEERQKRMELEFAERKAMLNLIQKLVSK